VVTVPWFIFTGNNRQQAKGKGENGRVAVTNADVEIVGIFSSFLFRVSASILIYVFYPS